MDWVFIWGAFVGLIAIINPVSTAFVFMGVTKRDSHKKRVEMAYRAVLVSVIILIFFSLTGFIIFKTFGITLEAFKIAGGVLIAQVGLRMLHAKERTTEKEIKESSKRDDVSIIPLAIPMLSGPGAITTMLVWTQNAPGIYEKIALLFVPIIIGIISYFVLINAKILTKSLGHTGSNVVGRLMGLIVLVMGVQFMINGFVDLVPLFI